MIKVTKTPTTYEVTIKMSQDVAETLRFLLTHVGGIPHNDHPRAILQDLCDHMGDEGIPVARNITVTNNNGNIQLNKIGS